MSLLADKTIKKCICTVEPKAKLERTAKSQALGILLTIGIVLLVAVLVIDPKLSRVTLEAGATSGYR